MRQVVRKKDSIITVLVVILASFYQTTYSSDELYKNQEPELPLDLLRQLNSLSLQSTQTPQTQSGPQRHRRHTHRAAPYEQQREQKSETANIQRPKMVRLSISYITDAYLNGIQDDLTEVTNLTISTDASQVVLPAETVKILARYFPALTRLSLIHIYLNTDLAKTINKILPKLTTLTLQDKLVVGKTATISTGTNLAVALEDLSTLSTSNADTRLFSTISNLIIISAKLKPLTADSLKAIAQYFPNVSQLDLRNVALTRETGKYVRSLLPNVSTIDTLITLNF